MTTSQPDRIDRIETILEQMANSMLQQTQNIQAILDFAAGQQEVATGQQEILTKQQEILESQQRILANHDSMISRLETLIERLVYREGRGQEPPEEQA